MVLRLPPPPQLANRDQALNRWLLELTSIINTNGIETFADGTTCVTQPLGDNSTLLASTAFVIQNAGGTPSVVNPLVDGVATPGTSLRYTREDHVHPTDTSRAPTASPTFTGVANFADMSTSGTATFTGTLTVQNNNPNAFSVAGTSANSIGFDIVNNIAGGHIWGFYSSGGGPSPLGSFVIYDSTLGGNRFQIDTTGLVTVSVGLVSTGAGGIGYAAGAGGTVAQATSKSTGVTLNKTTGQITMNAAALAAGTIVSFVLTDSAIAATDVLVLNHVSGGTPGAYGLNAQCAAGSATINVRNNTAGSLSEAIVLAFALVKGATS